jgi:hypothetical protein
MSGSGATNGENISSDRVERFLILRALAMGKVQFSKGLRYYKAYEIK